ncbi:hypothetical protein K435DRAFT_874303 [Dendrothele bispora CBS 962.96]|uniref:CCHC-type domain-containing protein n=1 Tax=Dendrothele bispora (strain CBS 962.96) TaxID=1314807 RepID=A0A4S8KXE5_DENBC|nr:hypothetical protein K435DRAFT_874303 [Dendrothele bispora CBS 962.96]
MSSPYLLFDEVNPWSDVASPMMGEAEYTSKPKIFDAAVNLDKVIESRSGILGDLFVHPLQPLSTYSISQKGDYFRKLYVAYAAEIGHLVEAKFQPPEEPELGMGRGANAAYDNKDVMDDATCCRDIWLNLVRRFQVKVENDTVDLKVRWMLTTCGDRENLDEWLMKDKAIIKSILDMGGHVSRDEVCLHIISKIPKTYRDFIRLQMTSYRLAWNGSTMPMQVIYDELRRKYNSRNPKLPDWAKSKEKSAEKSSKDSGSKSDHALSTEETKKKKPDMSKIKCYGCKKLGHFRRDCPDEDEKDEKKGKKDKEKKNKEKEKSKESGKDESKSKEGSDSKSYAAGCSKSGEKESQANVVEEIKYAYVVETMFEDNDSEDESMPSLQVVSDSEDKEWDSSDDEDGDDSFFAARTPLYSPSNPLKVPSSENWDECDAPVDGRLDDVYILTMDLKFNEEPALSVLDSFLSATQTIILDTGCTQHITPNIKMFDEPPKPWNASFPVGDDRVRLKDIWYMLTFGNGKCKIRDKGGEVVGLVPESNGLYKLVDDSVDGQVNAAVERLTLNEFHWRMGHISPKAARDLVKHGFVEGIQLTSTQDDFQCKVCIYTKTTRKPVPKAADAVIHI